MMKKPNLFRRYGLLLTRRSTVAMGLILAFGFIGRIVFWGGSIHDNTPNIHGLNMFWAARGTSLKIVHSPSQTRMNIDPNVLGFGRFGQQ